MVLLKPKSNRVPPLLQALLWFPHHLEQEPSPNNGPRGLTTSGPSTTLISSLPSCPLAQLLVSHRAFLLAARYIPTSGPLKLLFPLPGVLFPRRPHDPLLTFFTSLLTCHVLGQVFLPSIAAFTLALPISRLYISPKRLAPPNILSST